MTLPRVLSYPGSHPYVDRLHGRVANLVHRDEDRHIYDPVWIDAHAGDWDVAHLHFGHERFDTPQVVAAIRAHRSNATPVVFTVHDLQIPHLDPAEESGHDLIVAAATSGVRLITLTHGAAEAVHQLTGRRPLVIPHGPLLTEGRRRQLRQVRGKTASPAAPLVVVLGRPRPNAGWPELLDAMDRRGDGRPLHLHVRRGFGSDVLDRSRLLTDVTVIPAPRLPHDELEVVIATAGAVVLPYRWGTHSGLAELSADIGTPVITTDVGFINEQVPSARVAMTVGPDGREVIDIDAFAEVLGQNPGTIPVAPELERAAASRSFITLHEQLYESLGASPPVTVPAGVGR